MQIASLFDAEHIIVGLENTSKFQTLGELASLLSDLHPELDYYEIMESVIDRESKMNTAIRSGIAIPHGYCHGADGIFAVAGISRNGVQYDTKDGSPVNVLFLIVMGDDFKENYLRTLSDILRFSESKALAQLKAAKNRREAWEIISGSA